MLSRSQVIHKEMPIIIWAPLNWTPCYGALEVSVLLSFSFLWSRYPWKQQLRKQRRKTWWARLSGTLSCLPIIITSVATLVGWCCLRWQPRGDESASVRVLVYWLSRCDVRRATSWCDRNETAACAFVRSPGTVVRRAFDRREARGARGRVGSRSTGKKRHATAG